VLGAVARRSAAGWQFDPEADWRHFMAQPKSGFTWNWEPSAIHIPLPLPIYSSQSTVSRG
jgi:hypothetical protein